MAHGIDTEELMRRIQNVGEDGTLNLVGLNISSLPYIPNNVRTLDITFTHIEDLPPIGDNLIELYTAFVPLPLARQFEETMQTYINRWKIYQEEESKLRIQQRCRDMKEEIMIESLKPERVAKWVDAGFFD